LEMMVEAMAATGPLEEKLTACNDPVALGLADVAVLAVVVVTVRPHEAAAAVVADFVAAVVYVRC
jgi:hypothetical protein